MVTFSLRCNHPCGSESAWKQEWECAQAYLVPEGISAQSLHLICRAG